MATQPKPKTKANPTYLDKMDPIRAGQVRANHLDLLPWQDSSLTWADVAVVEDVGTKAETGRVFVRDTGCNSSWFLADCRADTALELAEKLRTLANVLTAKAYESRYDAMCDAIAASAKSGEFRAVAGIGPTASRVLSDGKSRYIKYIDFKLTLSTVMGASWGSATDDKFKVVIDLSPPKNKNGGRLVYETGSDIAGALRAALERAIELTSEEQRIKTFLRTFLDGCSYSSKAMHDEFKVMLQRLEAATSGAGGAR